MAYDEELSQLAHLLKVGAQLARDIADARGQEFQKLYGLAGEASEIAEKLMLIAKQDLKQNRFS